MIGTQKYVFSIIKISNYLLEIKCEKVAVLEMRSHVSWYLKGMPNVQEVKNAIFKVKTSDEMMKILNNYLKELENDV